MFPERPFIGNSRNTASGSANNPVPVFFPRKETIELIEFSVIKSITFYP